MKNYRDALAKYKFKDEHGHQLEHCSEYIDLITRYEAMRSIVEPVIVGLKLSPSPKIRRQAEIIENWLKEDD